MGALIAAKRPAVTGENVVIRRCCSYPIKAAARPFAVPRRHLVPSAVLRGNHLDV
jgi:hypothetical protein